MANTVVYTKHKTHKNGLVSYRSGNGRTDPIIYVQRGFTGDAPTTLSVTGESLAEAKPAPAPKAEPEKPKAEPEKPKVEPEKPKAAKK